MLYKTKCKKCNKIFESHLMNRKRCDECIYHKPKLKSKHCKHCNKHFTTYKLNLFCTTECLEEHEKEEKVKTWISHKEPTQKERRQRAEAFNQSYSLNLL